MSEIQKFDPNAAMASVKEKIKDSFVSLIPEEQWNDMVKKEIDSYFAMKEEGYGDRGRSSSFTKEVHNCLQDEVRTRVKEYLLQNFNFVWSNNGIPICNTKIEEFITANAGKVLSDMIGGMMSMALQNAGYKMNQ